MKLRFGDRVFDACSSLLVFNFIPDPALALRELKRVTRAGGVISAAVWDYGGGMTMLRTYWDAVVSLDPGAEPRDEKHMPLCRQGELAELWRRERLQAVEQRALDVTMRFESFADYWDPFLLGQGPAGAYARSLDDRRRQVLRDEVRRRLGQGAQAGEFQLKARAWAVRGTNGPTI
jgi:SAM-dependent methyltransferase